MIVDFRSLRVPLTLSILLCAIAARASEIREFDVKTLERLGNELTRVSQTPDRGATTPERKRAKQTAIAALKGKLFDIHYDYVVLDDPDGSGLLVYALALTGKPNERQSPKVTIMLIKRLRISNLAETSSALLPLQFALALPVAAADLILVRQRGERL